MNQTMGEVFNPIFSMGIENVEDKSGVQFNEKQVAKIKSVCDDAILFWRDLAVTSNDFQEVMKAESYIDAYQSMRFNLIGERLA